MDTPKEVGRKAAEEAAKQMGNAWDMPKDGLPDVADAVRLAVLHHLQQRVLGRKMTTEFIAQFITAAFQPRLIEGAADLIKELQQLGDHAPNSCICAIEMPGDMPRADCPACFPPPPSVVEPDAASESDQATCKEGLHVAVVPPATTPGQISPFAGATDDFAPALPLAPTPPETDHAYMVQELERLSHNAQIMGWTRNQAALDYAISRLSSPSPGAVETPNVDSLLAFARWALDGYITDEDHIGDLDGHDLEQKALELGLLRDCGGGYAPATWLEAALRSGGSR